MATLFIHGVGNPYGDLFAQRVADIVAPLLRAALQRAGRADEPHVRGVYWGDLGGAGVAAATELDDRAALGLAVLDRLRARLAEPDARLLLIGLGLSADQVSAACADYLRALPRGLVVDAKLTDLGPDLPAAVVAALRARGQLGVGSAAGDVADLQALLAQVVAFATPHLGALGRQPDIQLAVDTIRAGRKPLLDTIIGGWGELQTYLGPQGAVIRQALAVAIEGIHADFPVEPLRIVGHSLGGVVAYDLLNTTPGLPRIDLLVTPGSQVGLLAGAGLLLGQTRPASLGNPITLPPGLTRWVNVGDERDPLAFGIAGLAAVDGRTIIDRTYSSGVDWPASHSAYWSRPAFYDLLAGYYYP